MKAYQQAHIENIRLVTNHLEQTIEDLNTKIHNRDVKIALLEHRVETLERELGREVHDGKVRRVDSAVEGLEKHQNAAEIRMREIMEIAQRRDHEKTNSDQR